VSVDPPDGRPEPVRLGPFSLHDVLGRGGMGEVWRGRHLGCDLEVAVKVLGLHRADRPDLIAAFRNEVRAVAALDHPSIVHVIDYGEVTVDAQRATRGQLVAGSPWLAMELARAGSLHSWVDGSRPPLSWFELRAMLLRILDALAHAHARGLLHLDIKPANLLLCGPEDARPGLKLSDFGLARRYEADPEGPTEHDGDAAAGTPLYMAPEQIESQQRDFGPWTDLYSLGCVAAHLATGHPPFGGGDVFAIAFSHLTGRRRLHTPLMTVPKGFEDWLDRLLVREPTARYQRAADAAWALSQLPDPVDPTVDVGATTTAFVVLDDDTAPLELGSMSTLAGWDQPTLRALPPIRSGTSPERVAASRVDVPPMPADWRRPELPDAPPNLVGAGLGLFGLRCVPVVDRESERDLLWSALGQVAATGQPRWVLLEGPAGCGKSHLAAWLCERADELGAAHVLRAVHNPVPGRGDGLGPMLARHLRCEGLDVEEVRARLEADARPEAGEGASAPEALLEILAPESPPRHVFERPEERFVAIRELLEGLALDRPVVVWMEDLHQGLDSAMFADWLCSTGSPRPTPLLLLGTVRSEALAEREAERRLLEAARKGARVDALPVGPLDEEDRPAMVRALLGLEPRLAAEVVRRFGGNPLFAVQLVGNLVEQDRLEVSPFGYRLREGTALRLPPGLGDVWIARLDRALEGRSEREVRALQFAAILGQDVDPGEWWELCARGGADPSAALLDHVLDARLAVCGAGGPARGWSFVHGMLREALEEQLRREDRARWVHLQAAEMLRGRGAPPGRLGRHLLLGGAFDEAASALLKAASLQREQTDFRRSVASLDLWEQAMKALDAPVDDPRWFDGQLLRTGVERSLADLPGSLRRASLAKAAAGAGGDLGGLGWAMVEEARTRVNMGDYDLADGLLDQAVPLVERAGHRVGRATAHRIRGLVHLSRGELAAARAEFGAGVERFDELGDPRKAGYCLIAIAQAHKQAGERSQSLDCLRRAHGIFDRIGYRLGLGECSNGLGELLRLQGELAEAEVHYAEALRLWEAVGSIDVPVVRANLGLVRSARGDFPGARRAFEAARRTFGADGRADLEAAICVIMLVPLGASRQWAEFDRLLERGRELLESTGFVYVDVAREAERAGGLALAREAPERARQVWTIAKGQWEGLSRQEDADRVARLLAGIG
jgi:eukaryotic-like serine/threonine-protein kinase